MNMVRMLVATVFAIGLCLGTVPDNSFAADSKAEPTASTIKKEAKKADRKAEKKKPTSGSVDINTASREDLETLPGVGPVTAEAIVQYRKANGKFKTIDDLTGVKGIGEKTYAKIKPYLKSF